MAQLGYWVADWNLSEDEAAAELGHNVADMVDSIGSTGKVDLSFLKDTLIRKIAVYVTGGPGIVWTAGEIAAYRLAGFTVVTIDQHNGPAVVANVGDVESGAKTPAQAIVEAEDRLDAGQEYTIYVARSNLQELEAAWGHTGRPPGRKVAIQWASPTSNPDTIVAPGHTLRSANCDLSVTLKDWHPVPASPNPTPAPNPNRVTYLVYNRSLNAFAAVADRPAAHEGFDYSTVTLDLSAGPGWSIKPGIA